MSSPSVSGSGHASVSRRLIDIARSKAESVATELRHNLGDDPDIVVEPSDFAMFTVDYEHLSSDDVFERLAANSHEVIEYASGLLSNGADVDALDLGEGDATLSTFDDHFLPAKDDFPNFVTLI